MTTNPEEIAWFLNWLEKTYKVAPKRQWQWPAASANIELSDIIDSMRQEALADGPAIWEALREREVTGKWPNLKPRAAHFLRERILSGMSFCHAWLKQRSLTPEKVAQVRPSNPDAMALHFV